MRVLVATNDRTFTPSLVAAYANQNCEVVTGVDNLYYMSGAYDLIHLHWPEELIGWTLPTDRALERLGAALTWWRSRAKIVATVHNLIPHRDEHPLDRRLCEIVYRGSHVIGHFSQYSYNRIESRYGEFRQCQQVVHRPFLFHNLLEHRCGRSKARKDLGLAEDDFAMLAFGEIRQRVELWLLLSGIWHTRVPWKRLIFAGRVPGPRRRLVFALWRRFAPVISLEGYIPDDKVPAFFEAADAVLIVRSEPHLNSGVLPLAMTIGTPVVAPRYGMYVEYLLGTENELYEPGDDRALARAIERIAEKPRDMVVGLNQTLASEWGWPRIVDAYLRAVLKGSAA
jgi:glycosyltransferase involved in cell wall biosynthesis